VAGDPPCRTEPALIERDRVVGGAEVGRRRLVRPGRPGALDGEASGLLRPLLGVPKGPSQGKGPSGRRSRLARRDSPKARWGQHLGFGQGVGSTRCPTPWAAMATRGCSPNGGPTPEIARESALPAGRRTSARAGCRTCAPEVSTLEGMGDKADHRQGQGDRPRAWDAQAGGGPGRPKARKPNRTLYDFARPRIAWPR